jgi:acyl carrier protein
VALAALPPSRDAILAQLTELLVRSFALRPEQVHPQAHLIDDLELDSIDAIDLAVGVEEEIGLRLDEEELRSLRLVGDVVDLVERKLASAA